MNSTEANLLANLLGSVKTSAQQVYNLLGAGLARAQQIRWRCLTTSWPTCSYSGVWPYSAWLNELVKLIVGRKNCNLIRSLPMHKALSDVIGSETHWRRNHILTALQMQDLLLRVVHYLRLRAITCRITRVNLAPGHCTLTR
jgi:hypothetical protein